METLRFEFKKIWKNNYGRLFILFLLIAIIIISISTSNVENQRLEVNKQSYYSLLNQYKLHGKITADSEKQLLNLENEYNKAQESYNNIFFDYQLGKINRAEFLSSTEKTSDILNQKDIIEIIKNQYEYCKQDTENRYIMYSNGWNMLFSSNAGLLFLLFSIIVVTLSFAGDIDDGMKRFLITCKNGRNKLIFSKIIITQTIILVSYLIFLFVYIVYIKQKYGLGNGSYPIQSLKLYADYTGSNLIITTFILITAIRLFSILACVSIIIMLYAIIDSSIGAIVISFAIMIIPMILNFDVLKYLPQQMINYNLIDANFYVALCMNTIVTVATTVLSNIFWKRKSNSK